MLRKEKITEYALYAALFAFVALLPITKVADFDLFFHLKLGEHVLENRAIYGADEFSYTYSGPQWRGEWLGNAFIYAAYKAGGFHGLGLMKSALFVLLVFTVWKAFDALLPGKNPLAKALTIIVFAYAMRFRLDLRPYYFSYIGLALFASEFLRHRAAENPDTRRLWMLVPAQALWANLHNGFIVGPLILGFFLLTEAVRRKTFVRYGLLFLAVALAGALSPEGLNPYKGLIGFAAGSGAEEIGEWQRLSTHLLWGFGFRYTWGFQALFIGASMYLAAEAARKKFNPYLIAILIGSLYFSMRHVRLMDISSILLAPLFYAGAARLLSLAGLKDTYDRLGRGLLAIGIVGLIAASVTASRYYAFGFGPKEGIFPDRALGFMDEHDIHGNGFNTVTVGSYMLWKSPHRKVFIDGRLLQPPDFQRQYKAAIDSAEGFEELDSKYGFAYALADYNPKAMWRFPAHIGSDPDWALVYWDDTAALYLKKNEASAAFIEKSGYRLLKPSFNDFGYLDGALKHLRESALAEALRDLSINPSNQEAQLAVAFVSYYLDRRDITEKALETALSLPPDTAFEHISMAQFLLEKGDKDRAQKELRRAIKLDPYDGRAKELLTEIR